MRTMNGALAMGLIIAATSGLAAAPAFAADATTPASPPAKVESAPAPAAPAATNDTAAPAATNDTAAPAATNDTAAPAANDTAKSGDMSKSDDMSKADAATKPQANMAKPPAQKHVALSRHRVEQVQTALANSGENIPIDGLWGPKTSAALKDFQKSHGLKPTGHLNHRTIEALPKLST